MDQSIWYFCDNITAITIINCICFNFEQSKGEKNDTTDTISWNKVTEKRSMLPNFVIAIKLYYRSKYDFKGSI